MFKVMLLNPTFLTVLRNFKITSHIKKIKLLINLLIIDTLQEASWLVDVSSSLVAVLNIQCWIPEEAIFVPYDPGFLAWVMGKYQA